MSKSIHVLHVLNSAHGGSAISTLQLIEELKKRQIKSSLVCFDNATEQQKESVSSLVEGRVLFIPLYWMSKRTRVKWWKRPLVEALNVWKTWKGYKFQRKIGDLILLNEVNIVHTSTIVNPEGAIAAKRNNLPHVWHVRELIGPNTYYSFPQFQSWISFVESHANFLIANSQTTAKNLLAYFQQAKVKCIPNGIDTGRYKVKAHQTKDVLVIAMVGNVTSRLKNHEFFIRTAAHFRSVSNLHFRIYGALPGEADPYYSNLKGVVAQLALGERISFMGHVPSESIMADIDILFHPTGQESFGRIFIEAMAGGIPILAVDDGGAVELVRNGINGFRVPENNTQEATLTLTKMIDSCDLRDELGRNGRDIVEREYTLNVVADNLSSLYRSLI